MRQSKLFTKTIKQLPKDEVSNNAKLLIKAGFVDKLMAGVYSYLPLGLRVLKKIENIIRKEMDIIGGQEVFLPALHPKKIWEQTGRWKYEEMFKIKNRGNKDYGLGWTHEEIITPLIKKFAHSYKDLPIYVYQIQNKFRDELRAKSGLLRGTEFIMKDLYSFHQTQEDLDDYYEKVKQTYFKIFKKCGLKNQTFLTLASGGSFSKYSHEFQTITNCGEDEIYFCEKCKLALNKEIIEKEKYKCPLCGNQKLETKKSIEVGNIFKLKDRFTTSFNFTFPVLMGCYGIGLGRLMGVIIEVYHDNKGIIWPESVAPFAAHLLKIKNQKLKIKNIDEYANKIYYQLEKQGIEVLYDDRDNVRPGEKFADADLIGCPYRIVVSERTLANNSVEIKKRNSEECKMVKMENILHDFGKLKYML